jgi:hypothetical protein
MYTYKRAVGINQLVPRGEELLDISSMPTKELFTTYSDLTLVVTDELAKVEVAIDVIGYYNDLVGFTGTIQEWLDTKKTTPLKTTNTVPGKEYRFVTSHDIQYEWFSLLPGDVRLADDRQALLTTTGAPDIRVVKTDNTEVDFKALTERALWTVNGHLTRAVEGTRELYLLNAGKHFNVNDNIHVGCLNFNTVSKLATYPITAEMLNFADNGTTRSVRLDAPTQANGEKLSFAGKTVWMSLGGRLMFNDVVQVNGDKGVTLRTEKVDWFTRIFDSKAMIDLSGVIDKERDVVGAEFFNTEEFFTALLTDPSTFFIVLDNPNLYVWRKPLEAYQYPFTFHTEETRRIPLMVSNGLLPKYFTRKIINRRLLDIDLGINKRYLNKTTGIHNEGNLFHGFTNRFQPSTLFEGYLLYIRAIIQGA